MASRTPRRKTRRRPGASRSLAPAEPPIAVALRAACASLSRLGARYALVGGLAVSARAEPRLTRDVDLAISVDDDPAAEALVHALLGLGYRLISSVEQTRTKRLATARLAAPESELLVDLLFASCGIEQEIVEAGEPLEILPDLIVPVARAAHLVAMKLLARDDRERPQDLDDLRELIPTLDARERARVQAALTTIEQRGYSRGRDLVGAWRKLVPTRRRAAGRRTRAAIQKRR